MRGRRRFTEDSSSVRRILFPLGISTKFSVTRELWRRWHKNQLWGVYPRSYVERELYLRIYLWSCVFAMRMCPNAIHLSLRDFTLRQTKTARNSVEIAVKAVRLFSIIRRKPLHKTLFKINILSNNSRASILRPPLYRSRGGPCIQSCLNVSTTAISPHLQKPLNNQITSSEQPVNQRLANGVYKTLFYFVNRHETWSVPRIDGLSILIVLPGISMLQ